MLNLDVVFLRHLCFALLLQLVLFQLLGIDRLVRTLTVILAWLLRPALTLRTLTLRTIALRTIGPVAATATPAAATAVTASTARFLAFLLRGALAVVLTLRPARLLRLL